MGTELVGPCVKEESMDIPAIPPGFEALVPFSLKRVEDNRVSSSSPSSAHDSQKKQLDMVLNRNNDSKTIKSSRRRPLMKYTELDNSSGDESECEQHMFFKHRLPKGVFRGCDECLNCQKVIAKWNPDEARLPDLEAAPVFYPSEEEFEDTLKYISTIRVKAEKYGICRIVPPPSWKPPCPLKEKDVWEKSKFITRVQRIDKLQNRTSMTKTLHVNYSKKRKKRRCMKTGIDQANYNDEIKISAELGLCEAERFGFEPGPEFTVDAFQKYADDFKAQYFRKINNCSDSGGGETAFEELWQPSLENIEGEYWRIVEKPTEEIEVLYGADLDTGVFGSGFPKAPQQVGLVSDEKYINSGWNLNNFPRLPGSVLSFESSDISGVLVPWLYIGMCFSSFCWHVEDHHLYSLNYLHWGAPKMWYGVSGSDALKLEVAMRKHLPDLFDEQPDLLHKLVTQLSPSVLRSEGVPVYRCIQNAGEFVLTFPRAYHAGFNCGFNCAEAVNVAPVDWLPHGQHAIELYREQGRKTSISHDKLLLGAAREAVKANWEYNLLRKYTLNNLRWKDVCGKDGTLSIALKTRVEMEQNCREFLCKSSQALKMESSFDANSERECSICLFDLHLSAAGCHHCSPDKYACLNHAKQLCSCSWGAKFFLFRYDINELNILVEALEGKLSAVYRWARLDLGLALSSYVSKDSVQNVGMAVKMSGNAPGFPLKVANSSSTVCSAKDQKEQADRDTVSSSKSISGNTNTSQKSRPPVVVLALENLKSSSNFSPQKVEFAKHCSPSKRENSVKLALRCKISSLDISQGNSHMAPSTENLSFEKPEAKPSPAPRNNDVILLSDDEGDELQKENGISDKAAGSSQKPVCIDENLDRCVNSSATSTTFTGSGIFESRKHVAISEVMEVEAHTKTEQDCGADKVEVHAKAERDCVADLPSSSGSKFSPVDVDSNKNIPTKNGAPECGEATADVCFKPRQIDDGKPSNEQSHKRMDMDVEPISFDNLEAVSGSPSGSQNNLDRYYRQKGPRMAKVVRRINCNVEPLDFGVVLPGKLWCDSRAIYPKGFRSRVRYIDVTDPATTCYYVSEILDAGRGGPFFMVSVEHTPTELFVHVSAVRCWEMVRERVNHEIAKQHKFGKQKLPPLQPPGSLDGMEMFGFSSPAIVQVIQSMDRNRVCADYWKSRPLMQISQQPLSSDLSNKSNLKFEVLDDQETGISHPGMEKILNGLFKKANSVELHTLYSLLYDENSFDKKNLLTRLLNQEIHKHPK